MAKSNTRLELTWIGKENRPKLEPRVLIEDASKSHHSTNKRRELFNAQDAIDAQREDLIGNVEEKLKQTTTVESLFTIRWRIT